MVGTTVKGQFVHKGSTLLNFPCPSQHVRQDNSSLLRVLSISILPHVVFTLQQPTGPFTLTTTCTSPQFTEGQKHFLMLPMTPNQIRQRALTISSANPIQPYSHGASYDAMVCIYNGTRFSNAKYLTALARTGHVNWDHAWRA